jgi:glycosyltransferase involved in cell wall biosynthesis
MEDPSRVTVVPVGDTARLARALEAALAVSSKERGLRDSLGNARSRLSWRAYGERYSSALKQKLAATKSLHKSD